MFRNFLLFLIFLFLNVSCNKYKIENFTSYRKTNIQNVENLHNNLKEIIDEKRDIVILDFDLKGISDYSNSEEFLKFSSSFLSKELNKNIWINVLDRNITNKISSEIKLIELNGGNISNYSGPTEAEYILIGNLDKISFSSKLINRWILNGIFKVGIALLCAFGSGGLCVTSDLIPAYYDYNAEVSGTVQVFNTKTNSVIKSIHFLEKAEDSESATISNGIFTSSFISAKNGDKLLISKAIQNGLTRIMPDILTVLPLKGYISERRDLNNESDALFRVDIGNKINLEEIEDKGFCVYKVKNTNPITQEIIEEEIEIEAFKTNLSDSKGIWLAIPQKRSFDLKVGNHCFISKKKN